MFYAGKIIADSDAFYLLTVDDHNCHVGQVAEQLTNSKVAIIAAYCHDIGKKTNLEYEITKKAPKTPIEFLNAYVSWLSNQAGLSRKLSLQTQKHFVHALLQDRKERRQKVAQVVGEQLGDRLDYIIGMRTSPFPRHADGVPLWIKSLESDQKRRVTSLVEAGCPPEWVDYCFELIRLHHSFRVDKIVATSSALAARLPGASAHQFTQDLHTVISADNVASAAYEKVLNASEAGFTIGDPNDDYFLLHDLEISGTIEWQAHTDSSDKRVCNVQLDWKMPEATGPVNKHVDLTITYHVVKAS